MEFCRGAMVALLFCVCLCVFSVSNHIAGNSSSSSSSGASLEIRNWRTKSNSQMFLRRNLRRRLRPQAGETAAAAAWTRRSLVGPGSHPPACASSCGECAPCRPVHVPVPVPPMAPAAYLEYYAEVWLCECGGHHYAP